MKCREKGYDEYILHGLKGVFMGRFFNVAAACKHNLHYMVDITSRLSEIKGYVDRGEYFAINKARQYGKTTILRALKEYLKDDYYVISMDFQMQMSYAKFRNENVFSVAFAKAFLRIVDNFNSNIADEMKLALNGLGVAVREDKENLELVELFLYLSDICAKADKPMVLMIDEVDSAANNQVFLDFLAQLRGYYIDRDNTSALHSVILAGVYDIRNLKRKLRPDENHKMNSPWNIAMEFKVEMSFSAEEIAGMLNEYEGEHSTGMDIARISEIIYEYTSGYPFLVSKICKLIDEEVAGTEEFPGKKEAWTYAGFLKAERILLGEKNTLFESMVNKLYDFPELKEIIYSILFMGKDNSYNALDQTIGTAEMLGFIKNVNGVVVIANRIFETVFYNLFLSSSENQKTDMYKVSIQDKNQFVCGGQLNIDLLLEKYVVHFNDLYGDCTDRFKEEDGRRYFLLYLRPIINGSGNYYVESRTRNMERTDVIIDYGGEQAVVELKIWRGDAYNRRGEKQLIDYLDHYHLNKGYMLSYNFNANKQIGVKRIVLGDKILIEAVV